MCILSAIVCCCYFFSAVIHSFERQQHASSFKSLVFCVSNQCSSAVFGHLLEGTMVMMLCCCCVRFWLVFGFFCYCWIGSNKESEWCSFVNPKKKKSNSTCLPLQRLLSCPHTHYTIHTPHTPFYFFHFFSWSPLFILLPFLGVNKIKQELSSFNDLFSYYFHLAFHGSNGHPVINIAQRGQYKARMIAASGRRKVRGRDREWKGVEVGFIHCHTTWTMILYSFLWQTLLDPVFIHFSNRHDTTFFQIQLKVFNGRFIVLSSGGV